MEYALILIPILYSLYIHRAVRRNAREMKVRDTDRRMVIDAVEALRRELAAFKAKVSNPTWIHSRLKQRRKYE